jgi:hypothetical protein
MKMQVGDKINRLTLIKNIDSDKWGHRMGLFQCECGRQKEMLINSVESNKAKSCNCLRNEKFKKRVTTHGLTESIEYGIWCNIKRRCYNKNEKEYHNYGGRGIEVCETWRNSFENFLKDMGLRPAPKLTIERKNNNGNYCKENCEWNTYKVQANNRTNNIFLTLGGITKTLSQWSEITGISYPTLYNRLKHNLTAEQILTIKPASKNRWKNLAS